MMTHLVFIRTNRLQKFGRSLCQRLCCTFAVSLLLQLKKKVRVRKAADEEGAGLDLAALEAEAAAAGKSELGSRNDTAGRAAQAQKAQIADEAQRQSK